MSWSRLPGCGARRSCCSPCCRPRWPSWGLRAIQHLAHAVDLAISGSRRALSLGKERATMVVLAWAVRGAEGVVHVHIAQVG